MRRKQKLRKKQKRERKLQTFIRTDFGHRGNSHSEQHG